MKTKFLFLVILFFGVIISGCSEDKPDAPEDITDVTLAKINSCEGCHTEYEVLKEIAAPDTVVEGGGHGCGGEAPHIEPYDRVYLGGSGYDDFKGSVHGNIECTYCHNGTDNTDDKALAHSGDFIRHPSAKSEEKCGSCHNDVIQRTKNSLHEQGWGQKSMVATRSGVDSFDDLSELMKEGYNQNCAKCHGGCGDCHVNRPVATGGGLYKGHKFSKTPDMTDNCVACHSSRGGHAYFGLASGTVPDVHLTKQGFTCLNCHSGHEVHGDGKIYDQRYKMEMLPKCSNCHSNIKASNSYHQMHIETFSCNTCHSQDYNNCGSCHIGGDGARIESYQDFKLGLNPITGTKPYKFATLRRSLMAPDSWQNYGTTDLSNFAAKPTYKYSTPHNIIRWTTRTQVGEGKQCFDACHIIKDGEEYRNKDLYLFESDLLDWEKEADKDIIVDGNLPASWGNF